MQTPNQLSSIRTLGAFISGLLCCVLLSGCVSMQAFDSERAIDEQIDSGETRIWHQAEKIDAAIRRSGQLHDDPKLQAYAQKILDKLFPDFKDELRVNILKAPVLNAFALPNGSIYMNSGLMAAFENEAQLAAVLAHEGIHVIERHSAEQRSFIQNTAGVLFVARLLLIPGLPDLVAISSIYGFSRDHEREADEQGYQRMVQAGYHPAEGQKVFQRLLDEVDALDIEQPFFFSSHPALEERIDNFAEFIERDQITSGTINRKTYEKRARKIRMAVLAAQVENGMYKSVILKLEHDRLPSGYSAAAYYHLGEAYKLRNDDGDEDLAIQTWLKAAKLAPRYAPTHRELGIYYMKQEQSRKAKRYLQRYLALAPRAQDRGYIKDYLRSL